MDFLKYCRVGDAPKEIRESLIDTLDNGSGESLIMWEAQKEECDPKVWDFLMREGAVEGESIVFYMGG